MGIFADRYHNWLFVAENGMESMSWSIRPMRDREYGIWEVTHSGFIGDKFHLKKGSIEKLTGRKLTWDDEPVLYDVDMDEYGLESI